MYLQKLSILNFKNYLEANLDFAERINVFVGKNGSGKTNILDSIFFLSLTRSAFSSSDGDCIKAGEGYCFIKGIFNRANQHFEIAAALQAGSKKVFRENQLEYDKLSKHIGKYPVVLIAPDDADLVKDGSETRRKFFDSLISQLDGRYLENLILYNNALKQRNALLKLFSETKTFDVVALESYDRLLILSGNFIHQTRLGFLKEYDPYFQKYYSFLVEDSEKTTIHYNSGLTEANFVDGLKANRQKDLALQRTSFGIHRDDFLFGLGSGELKRFGSQGQQKSFIIALKLAQFEIFERNKSFKPLLLLDDIFDKLDDFRIARLLELIKTGFGQIFITDARPGRTAELMQAIGVPARIFQVADGKIELLNEQV